MTPWPPRFRWLKRLALSYLIFVTCLALLYWAWTAYSHRQLAAAIDAVHARGEPVMPHDFDPPPIPPTENAALALAPVPLPFKLHTADANWDSLLSPDARNQSPFLIRHPAPADVAIITQVLGRQRQALQGIRHTSGMTHADWGIRMRRNIISIPVPHLNEQRGLAQFLSAVALVRHGEGQHAETIELLRDIL